MMQTLAQLPGMQAVPELPGGGGGLTRYLFETPVTTGVGLLVIAMIVVALFNRAGKVDKGLKIAGLLVLAGVGCVIAATLVTTDRERMLAASTELVDAASKGDGSALERMLARDCTLKMGRGPTASRDAIFALVARYPGEGGMTVSSHRIASSQAVRDGEGTGRTQLKVYVRVKDSPYDAATGSTWRLHWRKSGDAWQVFAIECLQIDTVGNPGDIRY
jgi:hypothetical protein